MEKHIIFMCNHQKIAINIDATERILLLEDITLIPDTSSYIKGVIDYNEEVLPIVDMNERLFNETYQRTEQTKVIVAFWKKQKIGLIVDDVISVRDFNDQQLQSSNETKTDGQKKKSIHAIIRTEDTIITVIEVNNLFSNEGEDELLSIIETFAKEKAE
ncbi:chemotaxis protein CheW [Mycobacteroides abscessus]|uniref:chemotaxis protein CheW n=1 Tax=unclassified Desemzia TaxID=2685243 RepID=UPI0009A8C591|nr:Coupling protein CheW [Mycobacteroides abscessus subsp. abscessus]